MTTKTTTQPKCDDCGRTLPEDWTEGRRCIGCTAEEESEIRGKEKRKREAERRARLGPEPLHRATTWTLLSLASAAESARDALPFAPGDRGEHLRRALRLIEEARALVERAAAPSDTWRPSWPAP